MLSCRCGLALRRGRSTFESQLGLMIDDAVDDCEHTYSCRGMIFVFYIFLRSSFVSFSLLDTAKRCFVGILARATCALDSELP